MNPFVEKITLWIDKLVSLAILLVMLRLVLYMFTSLWVVVKGMLTEDLWLSGHDHEILDWVVFFIVMVKAYKVLVSYMTHQHVSTHRSPKFYPVRELSTYCLSWCFSNRCS